MKIQRKCPFSLSRWEFYGTIDPGKIEEYHKLIFRLIDETRKEAGNISYTLYADTENAGEFVLIEEWKDREILAAHFRTAHFTTIVPEIEKLHTKPSVVNVYEKLYSREQ